MAADNDELFPLSVMPVLTLCNSWFADVDTDLTAIQSMDKFGKRATIINIHFEVEDCLLFWKITEICAEQTLCKRVCRNLRNHERFLASWQTCVEVRLSLLT